MWKAHFHYLLVDSRVQECGVQLASRCDCCTIKKLEIFEHVFCSCELASQVWERTVVVIGLPSMVA